MYIYIQIWVDPRILLYNMRYITNNELQISQNGSI